MYKLIKEKGLHHNVILENTDTKANIILGRISLEMLYILQKNGYEIKQESDSDELTMESAWNITVDLDTASELTTLVANITKPIATPQEQEKVKSNNKNNKNIDALDVLLGIANYS